MKSFSLFIILSLAFSHGLQAAPNERAIIDAQEKSPQTFPNQEAIDSLSITPAPLAKDIPKPKKPYLFLYNSSFNFSTSFLHLLELEKSHTSFGFIYSDYREEDKAWEYGFNIFDNQGRFEFGQKFLINHTGLFRIHYGWLLGLAVEADKGLANLVNFQELLVGGMLGTEYVFSEPFSLRNDFRFFLGKDEIFLHLSLNLVYSW